MHVAVIGSTLYNKGCLKKSLPNNIRDIELTVDTKQGYRSEWPIIINVFFNRLKVYFVNIRKLYFQPPRNMYKVWKSKSCLSDCCSRMRFILVSFSVQASREAVFLLKNSLVTVLAYGC